MTIEIVAETNEPSVIYQGETVIWQKTWSDYPAGDWTLNYELRGPSSLTVTASATGDTFEVTISATTSATLSVGDYRWQSAVTYGTLRKVIAQGDLTVQRDIAEISADFHGVDVGSDMKRVYSEAVQILSNRAQLNQMPADELLDRLDFVKRLGWEVMREQDREQRKRDNKTTNKVGVRFTQS